MKVTVCPICRITPDIASKELKCPKCGRRAVGDNLNEAVLNWNNGVLASDGKQPKVVIKDEETLKAEVKAEIEELEKKEVEEKPEKKAPIKRTVRKKGVK